MKKLNLILLLFAVTSISFSQIKVTNKGNVGIGTLNPSVLHKVTLEGDSILLRSKTNNEHGYLFGRISFDQVIDFSPIPHNSNGWEYNLGMNFPFDCIASNNAYINSGCFYSLETFDFYNYSDKNLKKNIQTLPFDKNLFTKLNPVSFDISDSLLMTKKQKELGKKATSSSEYGFVAQEIQELYPQLVSKDEKTGYLKLKPLEFIPILVKAIQAQQEEIDALKKEIKSASNPSKVKSSSTSLPLDENLPTALYQNNPNPFSQSTEIKYYLPKTVNKALLCIYDLQGKQLKQITIAERGEGSQTINGAEFSAGIYLYGLIADGQQVDVKRMILTE